jgi:multisubunit Na+/H+ antiporter MnhC subunit
MKAMEKIKIIIAIAILATAASLFFNDCASAQTSDKPTNFKTKL